MRGKTELFLKVFSKIKIFLEVITAVLDFEKKNKQTNDTATENQPVGTKRLKRELRAEALARIEGAARTQDDFEKVVEIWDKLDANRERKERYHEIGRSDVPLDYEATEDGVCFPRDLNSFIWKQVQKGEFIDAIYNCPYEIHELVTDEYISNIMNSLSPEQKEILYYIAVKGYSTSKIACIRGQTNRNIRKVRNSLLKHIREKIYDYLTSDKEHNMTAREKLFVENYRNMIDNSK